MEVCADGPSGLAALSAFRPDVALVDIGLPGLDGYALARIARQGWTRYGQPHDRERAPFDRHVTKPMDPFVLRALIATI